MKIAGKLVEKGGIIGNEFQQRTAKAAKKWREILERISATVQTLAQQNFFLRSHRELLLKIPIQKIL
jgi:enamine deaminase RidA (YjgF/YER057c/UK114 family)